MTSYRRKWIVAIVVVLAAALLAARLYLNVWVTDYVNRVLNNIPGYEGSVADISIDLYRGAYRAHQLKIFKKSGNIPTPFVDIDTADLSIQWSALFHGRIVSSVDLIQPVLNFAVAPSGAVAQTGEEVDWTKPIKDLSPIDINLVTFREGKLTYQDFSTTPKVNIYIHHMQGEVKNLRNVVDRDHPLPSTIEVKGDSIGGGALDIKGRMNILKPVPDMDLDVKLEKVHLPALSDYSNAYAAIDIKDGDLDVYAEVVVKDNRVSGYVKPIARHIALIDLRKSSNPVKLAWESLVSVVVEIFSHHPNDQFATKVPLEGRLDDVHTNILATLGGILRNAFVSAFKKGFDNDVGASPDEKKDKP